MAKVIFKQGYTMPEVFCAKGRDGVTDIWGTISSSIPRSSIRWSNISTPDRMTRT